MFLDVFNETLSLSIFLYAFKVTEQLLAIGFYHSMLIALLPNDLVFTHTFVHTSDMTSKCRTFCQYFTTILAWESCDFISVFDLLLFIVCCGVLNGLVAHVDSEIPYL